MSKNTRLVYSTETGRVNPEKLTQSKSSYTDGVIRLSRETKGRKGKGVTLITGFDLSEAELKDMAKKLKQHCGSGGSIKDGVIEIQGDHRDSLLPLLEKKGFTVKKAGG